MKKTVLYVFIVIALMAMTFGVTYYFLNPNKDQKIQEKEPDQTSNSQNEVTSVKLKDVKKLSDNKYRESFEIQLNGKKKEFNVDFEYSHEDDYHNVKGTFNSEDIYFISKSEEETSNFTFDEQYIRNIFNEKDFEFIDGQDGKEYILAMRKVEEPLDTHYGYYLLNDNLEIIETEGLNYYDGAGKNVFTILDGSAWLDLKDRAFDDKWNLCTTGDFRPDNCPIRLSLGKDKIDYYQVTNIDVIVDSEVEIEHRVYTVSNDKVEYTVKDSFFAKGAGMIR